MYIRNYAYTVLEDKRTGHIGGGIHPFSEILYISSGQISLYWMGNNYSIHSPAIILLTPNTPHQVYKISSKIGFWYFELGLEGGDNFPDLEDILVWNELQCHVDLDISPFHNIILKQMEYLTQQSVALKAYHSIIPSVLKLEVQKLLLLIQHYLDYENYEEASLTADSPSSEALVTGIMRHLESEYRQDITLKDLSEQTHLNSSYLIRLFKDYTGKTPFQYLNELRMNAAINYLSTTQMTIQEISERIGYNSIHYFSRLFKQRFHLSPTQWRKENYQKE